jgi:Coenzyme PQQ synthesis protein D (PqqD)
VLRVADSVRSTHNQDGGVVLDIRHDRIYGLNVVGSRILELLKSGNDEAHIVEEIHRQFGVDPAVACTDVREFLASLEKHRLIEHRDVSVRP